MTKFEYKCPCGDPVVVEAENLDAAKQMIKDMMTEEKIAEHMKEKHADQPAMSKAEIDAKIDSDTTEVVA